VKNIVKPLLVIFFGLIAFSANAMEYKLGDLVVSHPHIRATPPKAPVSAGYLTIKNNGSDADRLLNAHASFAGRVQIHNMKVIDGVARMRPQKDGVPIPAGEEITLKPGGLHVMFMKLDEQMQAGEKRTVTLIFEKAGKIEINMEVLSSEDLEKMSGEHGHSMDHSHMNHDEMNHGEMKHDEMNHGEMNHGEMEKKVKPEDL